MNLYGRLAVNMSDDREFNLEEFADIINAKVNPPRKISPDEIHVRAIFLISDQVNSFGGRFPKDELARLSEMIVDSPVLVGHNKSGLPIARNFKAEVVTQGSENWLKVWFYWLKESEGSQALLANIDGGIYKEGSVGFVFSFPECGICGQDIRNCDHTPLKKYILSDQEITCYYNYRQIEKVLETSLVFRGANPGTRMTNDLIYPWTLISEEGISKESNPVEIGKRKTASIRFDREFLDKPNCTFYAAPILFGLPASCKIEGGTIGIYCEKERLNFYPRSQLMQELKSLDLGHVQMRGQLFKTKGKERIPLFVWKEHLSSELVGRFQFLVESVWDDEGQILSQERIARLADRIRGLSCLKLRKYSRVRPEEPNRLADRESRWGQEIISINGMQEWERIHIRKPYCLLMKVLAREKTGSGKWKYQAAFDQQAPAEAVWTYETQVIAGEGDTLLVRVIKGEVGKKIYGVAVEDNLGRFHRPDHQAEFGFPQKHADGFRLRIIQDSALLEIEAGESKSAIWFPQFNPVSLKNRSSLIGYPLAADKPGPQDLSKGSQAPILRGELSFDGKQGQRFILKMCGGDLEGQYQLRPAFWGRKELVLLSKVG